MTTPEIPSATVAKSVTAPKMRFLYPLAAVCLAAVFLAPSRGEAQTTPDAAQVQNSLNALGVMEK